VSLTSVFSFFRPVSCLFLYLSVHLIRHIVRLGMVLRCVCARLCVGAAPLLIRTCTISMGASIHCPCCIRHTADFIVRAPVLYCQQSVSS